MFDEQEPTHATDPARSLSHQAANGAPVTVSFRSHGEYLGSIVVNLAGHTIRMSCQQARELHGLLGAVVTRPPARRMMAFVDDGAAWYKALDANHGSPYSRAVLDFAEAWALAMEDSMRQDKATVADCAGRTRDAALAGEHGGLSGAQYGMAVSILVKCWAHGNALHTWAMRDEVNR